ncbi:short-chain dehydrogenase [Viridibacillus arvi]|uniref:short-chain dehydrogenase n=1 Tax=Viridibacillus arvi TaxID=263475 RepID=UPI00187B9023|nr:short-chain dehydrogenase [Viridibacillus sp. JNUCC-6]QOV12288.1 short-chain dehydrogenase [Viridibacillus sp. JNUCC-6]
MKHALVIGGTGMLANVTLWLLDNNYQVSIIARDSQKMESLINKSANKSYITPVLVNYENDNKLRKELEILINKKGPIDLVIAWIHTGAIHALPSILEVISNTSDLWELYHILGSSNDLNEIKKNLTIKNNCIYRQIQLGFIIKKLTSRWLTNNEISNGVIEAIIKRRDQHIVGKIKPWDRRP